MPLMSGTATCAPTSAMNNAKAPTMTSFIWLGLLGAGVLGGALSSSTIAELRQDGTRQAHSKIYATR